MKTWWLVVMALGLLPAAALAAVVKEGVDYKGWKCVTLENKTTTVFVAPELGGRIIQYRVDGKDWLWINEALAGQVKPLPEKLDIDLWQNYGGDKLWPAPQGWSGKDHWPGPGDRVMDAPYQYEVLSREGKEVKLKLIGSSEGGYAGVQYERTLTLADGSNKLTMEITMKNVSGRDVSWGIWENAQLDFSAHGRNKGGPDWNQDAFFAIPMNPNSRWPEKYHVMFGEASSFNWQPDYKKGLMIVRYMNFVGKMTMDVSAGWAAMVDPAKGQTFVERFPAHDAGKTYPDGGNLEVWVAGKGDFVHKNERRVAADDPQGRLIEMEPLGPQLTLKPGEETHLTTSWEVYKGGLGAVPEMKHK
jgi:hypothetical protein